MKGKKTENCGILETLEKGPKSVYGEDDDERACVALAKEMLLEAKEPLKYRTELLEALLWYEYKKTSNSANMDE